ncbi:Cardiolipin synthetase [Lysobacter dokdonensis DS-58]|uniref:Cardiolipin synthetase n=1 Tax=Lysobacter dokdonensis DS-58 TaxID=1300345 RepID=A0A0A2X4R0_9GAMM|nr:phospholipase D family protein [Lysobacter dokdonensis]KGQ20194.1 Cardiolipin synthetase [Lysobacter dokdonensis DS-58]
MIAARMARALVVLASILVAGGCTTLSTGKADRAQGVAFDARDRIVACERPSDACAAASALRDLGDRALEASAPSAPRHYALLLDRGPDALLARINLIRAARRSIDLQTYIFDEDDAGHLVLDELMAAARRGVRVRVLVDQLAALKKASTLAALSSAHANFDLRVYNPMFNDSRMSYPKYLMASLCCWDRLNQRMHSKLLLVDDAVGVTGGRNYQDDYYDWNAEYDFRDRDVLVAGPVALEMRENFEAFWTSPISVPAERLDDVGRLLLREGAPALEHIAFAAPDRVAQMSNEASDATRIDGLAAAAMPVGVVHFIADVPEKHQGENDTAENAGQRLRDIVESARTEVLLQTPYLVLSKEAQEMFRGMHARDNAPRVTISTNSLASTDAFIVYALSYKYKRRYLREFGFHIHEFKPFPASAPIDLAAIAAGAEEEGQRAALIAGAEEEERQKKRPPQQQGEAVATRYFGSGGGGANAPVPLQRAGVRIGLHAKSIVVDERIGVVGTHNFDPRGDTYNTESMVVIEDAGFARALADSIRGDMRPENAWVIAPRDKSPILPGIDYSLDKVSEELPIFDLWPWRYATSYDFVPGPECPAALPRDDPGFRRCYTPVGDFPEVSLGLKGLTTRIFTAFGAGLAPIL